MNKVFVLPPNEDWIIDRLVSEWYEFNSDISTKNVNEADVIWLLADFCWQRLSHILRDKKVITTIHHIVPSKFNAAERFEFQLRDDVTTVYHVPNKHTLEFIKPLTKKPIVQVCYWANQHIWKKTGEKEELRKKYGLPNDSYLVGSFQRDTEAAGIPQGQYLPKLEKGADLLVGAIISWHDKCKNYFPVEVVLGGWRRQYVMKRLDSVGIKYHYFEKPSQEIINDLYQTLDLYPVTARQEGGPQSLIECGLLSVPVVSRSVGIAELVLPEISIDDDVTTAVPTVPNVKDHELPHGFEPYRALIKSL